jgi:hypothetical protein
MTHLMTHSSRRSNRGAPWLACATSLVLLGGMVLALAACREGSDQGTPSAGPGSSASAASRSGATAGARSQSSAVARPPRSRPGSPDDEAVETVDDEPEVDHEDACAPADPGLAPLQLLRFTFTDGVANKDPKQKLQIARPGQRVYAHLRLRNRSGRKRCVHVAFSVGGQKRTEVTLQVGKSWSWRTWAYATPRVDDSKPLQVVVTDDQGKVIVKKKLAVVAR